MPRRRALGKGAGREPSPRCQAESPFWFARCSFCEAHLNPSAAAFDSLAPDSRVSFPCDGAFILLVRWDQGVGSIMDNRPIGVFDSGVGGLSIWRAIRRLLPQESLIFFADSGHVPYGEKSTDELHDLTGRVARFLLSQDAKIIVVARPTLIAAPQIRLWRLAARARICPSVAARPFTRTPTSWPSSSGSAWTPTSRRDTTSRRAPTS